MNLAGVGGCHELAACCSYSGALFGRTEVGERSGVLWEDEVASGASVKDSLGRWWEGGDYRIR